MHKIFMFVSLVMLQLEGNCQETKIQTNEEILRSVISAAVAEFEGTVGLAILHIESGDTLTLNNHLKFPMMSVYKFPQALTVLNLVDQGKYNFKSNVFISEDQWNRDTWSPMKKHHEGNTLFVSSIENLLKWSISYSDNIACEALFGITEGAKPVDRFIKTQGIQGIEIRATISEMHERPELQYENNCYPLAMTQLLNSFYKGEVLSDSGRQYLLNIMTVNETGQKRIKGLLPDGTYVAHKTGTSTAEKNRVIACNDVGIITTPNGEHIVISVFVKEANAGYENCELMIAKISKWVYDFYTNR